VYHLNPRTGWMSGYTDAFYLKDNCNTNSDSYSKLGFGNWVIYSKPSSFPLDPEASYSYLAGASKFKCKEIEVYKVNK